MKTSIPFIIIAICAGMYFMYIKPSWSNIQIRKVKYEEYQKVLDRVKEINQKREELSTKYNNISGDDLSKLDKMIPKKFVSEYFVNDINAMSSRDGMRISQMDITLPTTQQGADENTQIAGNKFETINVRISLEGSFDQFLNFMKDMETSLRLIDVISITAKSGSGGGPSKNTMQSDLMTFLIEVKTYSLR